jgi:hypothetical protein
MAEEALEGCLRAGISDKYFSADFQEHSLYWAISPHRH